MDYFPCQVCNFDLLTAAAYDAHLETVLHKKKQALCDLLNSDLFCIDESGLESILAPSVRQHATSIFGEDNISEFRQKDSADVVEFWACGCCYAFGKTSTTLTDHVTGTAHKLLCIKCFMPSEYSKFKELMFSEQSKGFVKLALDTFCSEKRQKIAFSDPEIIILEKNEKTAELVNALGLFDDEVVNYDELADKQPVNTDCGQLVFRCQPCCHQLVYPNSASKLNDCLARHYDSRMHKRRCAIQNELEKQCFPELESAVADVDHPKNCHVALHFIYELRAEHGEYKVENSLTKSCLKCRLCDSTLAHNDYIAHVQTITHKRSLVKWLKSEFMHTIDKFSAKIKEHDKLLELLTKQIIEEHGRGKIVVLHPSLFRMIKKYPNPSVLMVQTLAKILESSAAPAISSDLTSKLKTVVGVGYEHIAEILTDTSESKFRPTYFCRLCLMWLSYENAVNHLADIQHNIKALCRNPVYVPFASKLTVCQVKKEEEKFRNIIRNIQMNEFVPEIRLDLVIPVDTLRSVFPEAVIMRCAEETIVPESIPVQSNCFSTPVPNPTEAEVPAVTESPPSAGNSITAAPSSSDPGSTAAPSSISDVTAVTRCDQNGITHSNLAPRPSNVNTSAKPDVQVGQQVPPPSVRMRIVPGAVPPVFGSPLRYPPVMHPPPVHTYRMRPPPVMLQQPLPPVPGVSWEHDCEAFLAKLGTRNTGDARKREMVRRNKKPSRSPSPPRRLRRKRSPLAVRGPSHIVRGRPSPRREPSPVTRTRHSSHSNNKPIEKDSKEGSRSKRTSGGRSKSKESADKRTKSPATAKTEEVMKTKIKLEKNDEEGAKDNEKSSETKPKGTSGKKKKITDKRLSEKSKNKSKDESKSKEKTVLSAKMSAEKKRKSDPSDEKSVKTKQAKVTNVVVKTEPVCDDETMKQKSGLPVAVTSKAPVDNKKKEDDNSESKKGRHDKVDKKDKASVEDRGKREKRRSSDEKQSKEKRRSREFDRSREPSRKKELDRTRERSRERTKVYSRHEDRSIRSREPSRKEERDRTRERSRERTNSSRHEQSWMHYSDRHRDRRRRSQSRHKAANISAPPEDIGGLDNFLAQLIAREKEMQRQHETLMPQLMGSSMEATPSASSVQNIVPAPTSSTPPDPIRRLVDYGHKSASAETALHPPDPPSAPPQSTSQPVNLQRNIELASLLTQLLQSHINNLGTNS